MDYEDFEKTPEWKRIKAAFLSRPKLSPSEAFVFQVMEKIRPEPAFEFRDFLRWLVPTTTLMILALFFVSVVPMNAEEPDMETVIAGKSSPYSVHESAPLQTDLDRDWMGLEVL